MEERQRQSERYKTSEKISRKKQTESAKTKFESLRADTGRSDFVQSRGVVNAQSLSHRESRKRTGFVWGEINSGKNTESESESERANKRANHAISHRTQTDRSDHLMVVNRRERRPETVKKPVRRTRPVHHTYNQHNSRQRGTEQAM